MQVARHLFFLDPSVDELALLVLGKGSPLLDADDGTIERPGLCSVAHAGSTRTPAMGDGSEHYEMARSGSADCVEGHPPVEGDQASGVNDRQREQVGVRHMARAVAIRVVNQSRARL